MDDRYPDERETRQTSREAYAAVMKSGLLSKRRAEVYRFCTHEGQKEPYNGRISRVDVKNYFADRHDSFCRRLTELAPLGLMVYDGTKVDSETGRNVDVYKVALPVDVKAVDQAIERQRENGQRMTPAQALLRLVSDVEAYVAPLVPMDDRDFVYKLTRAARYREPYDEDTNRYMTGEGKRPAHVAE